MFYAIGKPNEPPRLMMQTQSLDQAEGQCLAGEVAVPADTLGDYQIESHGQAICAREIGVEEARATLWLKVKRLRDELIASGLEVEGLGRFDTDEVSRGNITSAVTAALMSLMVGGTFSETWKLADNSTVELSANQMVVVGQAVTGMVSACHARSQSLGVALQAAATCDEVAYIDITQGWPLPVPDHLLSPSEEVPVAP